MAKRKRVSGAVFYDVWFMVFDVLSVEDAGHLIKAISHHIKGKAYELPAHLTETAGEIFEKIDADRQAYNDKCDQLSANAKQRGANAEQMQNNCTPKGQQMQGNNNNNNNNNNNPLKGVYKENTKEKQNDIKDGKPSNARFIPPTVEEVREYCQSRNNFVDPEGFVNFYTSNGWKVGKNPMKNWKAAVVTWEKRTEKLHRDTLEKINATKEESDEEFFAQMFKEAAIYDEQHGGSNITAIQPSLPGSIF